MRDYKMTMDEFKENIAPYMNKGWVAMNGNGLYCYYEYKPVLDCRTWVDLKGDYIELTCFDIKPVEDWTISLIKVGV